MSTDRSYWSWESDGGGHWDGPTEVEQPKTYYAFSRDSGERIDCRSKREARAVALIMRGDEGDLTPAQLKCGLTAIQRSQGDDNPEQEQV